jgi:hypothetical protein
MVDESHSALRPDGIDARLQDFRNRRPALRRDHSADPDCVHMNSLVIRDFFGAEQDKVVSRIRVERRRIGERVVVGDGEKLVAVALVPGNQIPW